MLWTGPILECEVASSYGVHMYVLMDVAMGVPMMVARPCAPRQQSHIRACERWYA
jgi:hypothetical protein